MIVKFMLIGFGRKLAAFRFFVARIVEAIVFFPGNSAEFHVFYRVFYSFSGFGIDDDDFSPVTTTFRNSIGCLAAIFRKTKSGQGGSPIFAKFIRI